MIVPSEKTGLPTVVANTSLHTASEPAAWAREELLRPSLRRKRTGPAKQRGPCVLVVLKRSLSNKRSLVDLAGVAHDLREQPGDDYEPTPKIRQRQTRLRAEQVEQLVTAYLDGATTYELAERFKCNRHTVSEHLRRAGVRRRLEPLTAEQVDEAARRSLARFSGHLS